MRPSRACTTEAYSNANALRIKSILVAALLTFLWLTPTDALACTNPAGNEGDTIYNGDFVVAQYCDGTDWIAMNNEDNGLVGYWRLDETSGTTAIDSSPNSNNGTMNNGLDASNDSLTGIIDGALDFDGGDDTISIIDGWRFFDNDFTVSIWVNPQDNGSQQAIFGTRESSTDNVHVRFTGSEQIRFGVKNVILAASGTIAYDEWNHYVFTRSGSNGEIFRNGTSVGTTSAFGTGAISEDSFNLGYGAPAGGNRFFGKMDEVRVYDRVLTAPEIDRLYNAGRDRGLVGHWKLDETGATTTAIDSSPQANTGTMSGGLSGTDSVTGKINTALDFDGSNDYIQVASGAALDAISSDYTICAWINPRSGGENDQGRIFSKRVGGLTGFVLTMANNTISGGIGIFNTGGTLVVSNPDVIDWNEWQHVCGIHDDTANRAYLYVNNTDVTSATNTMTEVSPTAAFTRIGDRGDGALPRKFDGAIDDLRVYNRILSTDEIFALYAARFNTCENPFGHEGDIRYDGDNDVMTYCNADGWKAMGPAGDGGAGCSNPTGARGDMIYNDTATVMTYCEGDDWVAIGK